MTRTFNRSFAPKRFRPAARAVQPGFLPTAVPATVVDAVLRFHDETQDQGAGRTLLRLSARRLHDAEVLAALGQLTARAAGVSILWNEREGEIIRVLEETPRLAA
jgi:hypothetical protein